MEKLITPDLYTPSSLPEVQVDPVFEGLQGGPGTLIKYNPLSNVSSSEVWNFLRAMVRLDPPSWGTHTHTHTHALHAATVADVIAVAVAASVFGIGADTAQAVCVLS